MKLKLCNDGLSVFGINEQGQNVSYSIEAEEYKQWIAEGNIPEPEFTEEEIQKQELQVKINEAKQYLAKTDHKFYGGYKPKEGEDLVEIEILRDEAREVIRSNKGVK